MGSQDPSPGNLRNLREIAHTTAGLHGSSGRKIILEGAATLESWDGAVAKQGGDENEGTKMSKVTQAHIDARRQCICDAAVTVFARKGVQNATMAEIAECAGLSAGAIYRYYANKDALATACMQDSTEQVVADWRRMGEEDGADPRAVFDAMTEASFAELKLPIAPDLTMLMVENQLAAARSGDAALRAEAAEGHAMLIQGLADALGRMQAAGQFPRELDVVHTARALMAFYMGVRLMALVEPEVDTHAQLEQVRAMMVLSAEGSALRAEVPVRAS